jgi:hypothetical protein
MTHRDELLRMIERLVSGEWSVPEFEAAYYEYYLDEVNDDSLSDRESEFFGAVHEKLDWTDKAPDPESRAYGWVDHDEFREWLQVQLDDFYSDGAV